MESLGFGIVDAAVLAVAAVGFTLQFGVTNYVNFAYGAILTFGAYVAVAVNQAPLNLNIWAAVAVAAACTSVFAVVLNRLILGPFSRKRRQLIYLLVVTVAVSELLDNLYIVVFGTSYQELTFGGTTLNAVGPFLWSENDIIMILLALASMAILQLLLSRTKLGKFMRATADDHTLAEACGIPTRLVIDATWALSGALAGMAGVLIAIQQGTFSTTVGDAYIFFIFGAVIVGGIGRPYGALAGAVLLGVSVQVAQNFLPLGISPVLVFVALVFVMTVRPRGLFGSTTRPALD